MQNVILFPKCLDLTNCSVLCSQSIVFCGAEVDLSLEMHKGLHCKEIAQSLNKMFELVWKTKSSTSHLYSFMNAPSGGLGSEME